METNIIYNEDFMEGIEKIPDKSVDLLVTDPPYLHVKGGMKSKKYNVGVWGSDSYMVDKMSDFDGAKIDSFLDAVIPKMKKVNMYIFCSKLQLVHYFNYIQRHKKLKYDLLVWDKVKYSLKSTKFFTSDLEYVVRIYEAGVSLNKILVPDGSKSDIKYYTKRQAYEQPRGVHGTMKPVDLIAKYIELSSNEGDVVLDCFMGSGTTAVACEITNRKYIGFEIIPDYYQEALKRLEYLNQEEH